MKSSKHKNIKTVVDNITFDSKKEAARYCELKLLHKAGKITNLELQKPFVVCGSVVINGRRKPAAKYIADFVYLMEENGEWYRIVEDVKSPHTRNMPVYRLKIHLLKAIHDINVVEI